MFGFWEKIKHRRLRVLLSSYIDGQVSATEAARVEEHLAHCDGCRVELESLRATVELLSGLPELAAPRSFALTEAPATGPAGYPRHIALTTRFATSVAALLFVALVLGDILGVVTQGGEGVKDISAGQETVAEMAQEAPSLAESAPAPAPLAARLPEAPAEAAEEDTAGVTPQPVERAVVVESKEEKALAAPVEEAVAVTPETVTSKDEAEAAPTAPATDDDGIRLPVWQLEVAIGGLLLALALTTLWVAMRRRRQFR